jgi:hypothetical protein
VFFDKESIENRIKCKVDDNQDECKKIEVRKCLAKGITTQEYEICMIAIYTMLG